MRVIKDKEFLRENVPMTKEEVRILSLCKLDVREYSNFLDIGAGTGSVAIQCAVCNPTAKVYAAECNCEAIQLLEKNINWFNVENIEVLKGYAPDVLNGLTGIDRVFIGGNRGRLSDIFKWLHEHTGTIKIILNFIVVENMIEAKKLLQEYEYKNIEIIQVAVSRGEDLGGKTMMKANNPVYIVSAEKDENAG